MTYRWPTAIGAITVSLSLASCGQSPDSSETAARPSGTTVASTGKPSTPLDQLLPSASDFPAGTKVSQLDAASLGTDVWEESKKTSTFAPADCGPKFNAAGDAEKKLMDGPNIFAMSTDPMMSYTVVLADLSHDLAPIRGLVDTCPSVHREFDFAGPIVADVRYERLELPGQLPQSDAISYATDINNKVEGPTSKLKELRGIAVLRGVTVFVNVQGLGGATPDRATFDDLFLKVTRKVADAA